MNSRKANLILIYPGPQYKPEYTFEERLTRLSERYTGMLLTTAPDRKDLTIGNFDVVVVPVSRIRLMTFLRLVRELFRRLRELQRRHERLDLVASYDPLRSGLLAVLTRALTRARFVTEVNGDYANIANYHDVKPRWLASVKRRLYVAVERFVIRRSDGIKLLYPEQLTGLNVDTANKLVRTFPNRVFTERFRLSDPGTYVLTVGFPWQVKGIDLTIRAFLRVADEHPDWHLKVVGHFRDPEPLKALISDHPRIVLLKPVHHDEMPEIIGNCGFVAQASRTESMGRVLVEAMAAGKPRIGTKVGGIPTVISDGIDGFLVRPESVDELAVAMQRLMTDKTLRLSMGRAARQRARDEFSGSAYYAALTRFYADALGTP